MKDFILILRSTTFNFAFYGLTALACIALLPGLLLPRKKAMGIVRLFVGGVYFLERNILLLDYEVRGREHLPRQGSFIVAAKHQSPYETMKLNVLFDDPAIVLKRELLRIPLWGRYLAISDPIAIDRSKGKESMKQLMEGANRVKEQGRPVIIFPQGTRVWPWQTPGDKPYKPGAVRMGAEAGLPVIPMALNSGMFWPRRSWLKRPGKVVFEFLPPAPEGSDTHAAMRYIQDAVERHSLALADEAASNYGVPPLHKREKT